MTNRVQFDPLERRTLPEEIRDRIRQGIVDGQLRPGEQLPSERQLCEDFSVARTSVREAIQGLISLGLVERRANRTFVTDGFSQLGLNELDTRRRQVRELFEVRRVIELPMAELAACRATDKQREDMLAIASRFVPGMPLDEFRALDREFHWSVAQACGNNLLTDVYGRVLDALFQSDDFARILSTSKSGAMSRLVKVSVDDHKRLAKAIARGDVVASAAAIVRHLDSVEERLVKQVLSAAT